MFGQFKHQADIKLEAAPALQASDQPSIPFDAKYNVEQQQVEFYHLAMQEEKIEWGSHVKTCIFINEPATKLTDLTGQLARVAEEKRSSMYNLEIYAFHGDHPWDVRQPWNDLLYPIERSPYRKDRLKSLNDVIGYFCDSIEKEMTEKYIRIVLNISGERSIKESIKCPSDFSLKSYNKDIDVKVLCDQYAQRIKEAMIRGVLFKLIKLSTNDDEKDEICDLFKDLNNPDIFRYLDKLVLDKDKHRRLKNMLDGDASLLEINLCVFTQDFGEIYHALFKNLLALGNRASQIHYPTQETFAEWFACFLNGVRRNIYFPFEVTASFPDTNAACQTQVVQCESNKNPFFVDHVRVYPADRQIAYQIKIGGKIYQHIVFIPINAVTIPPPPLSSNNCCFTNYLSPKIANVSPSLMKLAHGLSLGDETYAYRGSQINLRQLYTEFELQAGRLGNRAYEQYIGKIKIIFSIIERFFVPSNMRWLFIGDKAALAVAIQERYLELTAQIEPCPSKKFDVMLSAFLSSCVEKTPEKVESISNDDSSKPQVQIETAPVFQSPPDQLVAALKSQSIFVHGRNKMFESSKSWHEIDRRQLGFVSKNTF